MAEGAGHQSPVRIEEAGEITPGLVADVARLISQLSQSSPPPAAEELEAVLASPATTLLVAVVDHDDRPAEVVGTLTLVLFRTPGGMKAWIEDVVVDGSMRGRGVGELLTAAALDRAGEAGAKTVDLTSRPSREAANRLYQRLGFVARETNVYRHTLSS